MQGYYSSTMFMFMIALSGCGEKNTSLEPPDTSFYAAMGEDCCGEDPHPVHGIEASDGSFILCGKSLDSEGSPNGFLVKVDPQGLSGTVFLEEDTTPRYEWSQTFGQDGGFDAANAVASIGDAVFLVGTATVEDLPQRILYKYDLVSGELIWAQSFFSMGGTESAFESVYKTPEGGLIAAGFSEGAEGGIEGFKSYGNPVSGRANVMYFAPEQLNSSNAPTSARWERDYDLMSVRSIRPVETGGYVFLAAVDEEVYAVVRIDDVGEEIWRTTLDEHGEATDITELSDGTGFAVSGHKALSEGIDGRITMLDTEGRVLWGETYGNPQGGNIGFSELDEGNPALIFDECWGIQSTVEGGAVMACGTGIEGCDEFEPGSSIHEECISDPRTTWRSLVVEVDRNGKEVWSRTDSYYFSSDDIAASAAEYIINTAEGGYAAVIDQDFGIGLILFE